MEEINLKDLFSYFVKKIPLMLVIIFGVFLAGICYTLFFKTPLYKGDTTLILVMNNSSNNNSSSGTQVDITVNQKLVATYSEIVKSRRVLNQVIEKLGLEYDSAALGSKISVNSVSSTEIIKISVSDVNNETATLIADTVAEVFKEEIAEIYNLENVSIIDSAEVRTTPYNINVVKESIVYFAIGIIIAFGITFVVYYFDTSIKSSEEIETKLGIPVIGNVPVYTKGKKKGRRK